MTSPYRCGPGWMPEWMRRLLSIRFNSACAAHDSAYQAGLVSKRESDRKFLSNMIGLAGWNPFWYLMAYVYHWAALTFGGSRYTSSREDESA